MNHCFITCRSTLESFTNVNVNVLSLYLDHHVYELKRLSETRWTSQIRACIALSRCFPTLMELLEVISEEENRDRALKANALLALFDVKFVFCLHMFTDILHEMKGVSAMLQKTALDISVASDTVCVMKNEISLKRNDDNCEKFADIALRTCRKHDLSCEVKKGRKTTVSHRLPSSVVTESLGRNETVQDVQQFLRREIFYPTIDKAVTEINARFSTISVEILRGIDVFVPEHPNFLNAEVVKPLAEHYKSNIDDINMELRQVARMMQRKKEDGTLPVGLYGSDQPLLNFTNFIEKYKEAFFELHRLSRIAATIPITTASAERSFSTLKLIKTYLRTTMSNERLSNLAMLALHKDRAKYLDLDRVVDIFVNMYPNCRITLV